MAIARFKRARVNIDYHVELDGHYYSVPHRLVGTEVELRITATTVEVLASSARVAVHAYSARKAPTRPRWPSTCRRRTART
jgi:hypothetical protein